MSKNGTNKLTLANREWICSNYHKYYIRDLEAVKNILVKELAKLA